jgi:hypothetical protein
MKVKVTYRNPEFAKVRRLIARQAAPSVSPSDIQALRVLRTMPAPGFLFTIADEPTGRTPKAKDKPVQRQQSPGAVALAKLPMAHLNG